MSLYRCRQQPEKIFLSNKYINPSFSNIEHMDIGLSFTNNQGVSQSTLIMHFNAKDLLKLIVNYNYKNKYNVLITNKDFTNTVDGENIKVSKDSLRKISTKLETSDPDETNAITDSSGNYFLYRNVLDTQYVIFINKKIPFYKEVGFLFPPFKHIPIIFLIFFLPMFLAVWYKRTLGHSTFKMLKIIKRTCDETLNSTKNEKESYFKIPLLSYFKDSYSSSRNMHKELSKIRIITLKREAELQVAFQTLSEQQEKLKINDNLIGSIKHYRSENTKFKKKIGSYLRAKILDIITKSEILVKDQEDSDDIILNNNQRIDIVKEININLKNIFNSMISSEKSLIDPIETISEALASVMIYAVLRNVEIKTHFKNNFDKIWADKLRLQIIIIGIVFQSIDASPNGGEISIVGEKISLENRNYLNITIEDNSYDLYQGTQNNSYFEFEHISLENIQALIEEERGMFDLKHQLNKGKKISIFIPYNIRKEEAEKERESNVYSLF